MGRRLWHPGLYLALAVVLALGLAPGVTGGQGLRESMFTILMSVGLSSSLNILVGYTGYVSFGHIVFFGLGGYVGFAEPTSPWPPWASWKPCGRSSLTSPPSAAPLASR